MLSIYVNNLYTIEKDTQFYSVKTDQVTDRAIQKEAIRQLKYDARIEILKTVAHYAIAFATTLAVATIAIVAFKVGAFIIGCFAFPLAVIPPLYSLATTLGGLLIGGGVGYATFKRYASQFIEQAQIHWNHSQHLYKQIPIVENLVANKAV